MGEIIRKAELNDIPRIQELCADIWDGYDYLPNVAADWIKDPEGEFCVVEVMGGTDDPTGGATPIGHIATLGKMSILNSQDGWLEGLRGNNKYKGQGYAQKLTRYFIEKALSMNLRSLRLATYFGNSESIHILHKYGFREIQRFVQFELSLTTGEGAGKTLGAGLGAAKAVPPEEEFRVMTMADLDDALWSQIVASPWLQKAGGFISHAWVFWKFDRAQMQRWIAEQAAYLFPATGELGIFQADHHEQAYYQIQPLLTKGLEAASLNRLVKLGQYLAQQSGRSSLVCNCPDAQALFQTFFALGFRHFEMDPPEVGHTIVLEYDLKR